MNLGALPLPQPEERPEERQEAPVQNLGPEFQVIEDRQRVLDRAFTAIHGFTLGALPLELYKPSQRALVEEEFEDVKRQSCIPLNVGSVELRRSINDAIFRWAFTRWDSDTKEYPAGERLSLESRMSNFLSSIHASLPFSHHLREKDDLARDIEAHMDLFHTYSSSDVGHKGSQHGFDDLLEDQMRISYLIPEDPQHGSLPFESLRDFVQSLLPTQVPMSRPTLRYKSKSIRKTHAIGKATREDPDLVHRLIQGFGQQFPDLHGVLSGFEPYDVFEENSFHSFVGKKEWPDEVREIRSIRARIDDVAPGSIVRIAHSDPERKLLSALDSIPPFKKAELEPWAERNGLSPDEVDILYNYLLGKPPKKISTLEALMVKLFKTGGDFYDETVSLPSKPIVISEKGQRLDPWTQKLLEKIKSEERDPEQTLLFETNSHADAMLQRIRTFSKRKEPITLGCPDFYKWSDACERLARAGDPHEAYEAFQTLIEDIWGDLEAFRSYVSSLVDTKKAKAMQSTSHDPRFTALLAIQRGWIECMSRILSQGVPEESNVKVSVQTLSDIQRFLSLHVGKAGFSFNEDYIKWLVYSNDPLLFALTEADYYAKDTNSLGLHLAKHLRGVGAGSNLGLSSRIHDNPIGLYACAKLAYLKGDYEGCLVFVETVVRPSKDSSYYDDFLHELRDKDDAKKSDESELRKDKAGLRGYAPILIKEDKLVKELVRMGLMCIRELPPAEGEEAEKRRSLEGMFKNLQGELAPSHLLNLHLAEAQKARDAGDDEGSDYHIECSWKAIGDQNGYQARRIEHNMAEIEVARLEKLLANDEDLSDPVVAPHELHDRAGKILVMERNLHLEERKTEGGAQNLMRVWEYDASYFQALVRFAEHRMPEAGLPTVERRKKEPFAFDDFVQRPISEWIMESSRLAQESLQQLSVQSPGNAKWAGEQIIEWLTQHVAQIDDEGIQKLPLLAGWEALVIELKGKSS